jgi:MFS family permease
MTDTIPETALASTVPAHQPLRRNRQFQAICVGQASSSLGVSVADVAYPLAILAVTGSPARAGLFAAVQTAAMLAAGLPAGQLADRRDPRRILIISETCRALVSAAVAAALATGWLTFPLLIGAAVLLGLGQPVAGAARLLLVRAAVPKEQLTRALTLDEVRINGAGLAGPPLGAALYGLRALAHAAPFAFTAGSFVLSLLSALMTKVSPDRPVTSGPVTDGPTTDGPVTDGPGAGRPGSRGGMLVGVRAIWASPLLRATTLLIMSVNTVGAGLTLIAIVILKDQSVPSAIIGVALGCEAVGGLAGAPLVRPLHRLRPGVLLIAVCLLEVPLFALLAVPYGPWWMAGLLFISALGVPSIRVLLDILILRQAPDSERGRVAGAVMTLMGLGMPAGLAIVGLLLQYLSAQAAMLILAGTLAAGVLYGASKRELWQAAWPQ